MPFGDFLHRLLQEVGAADPNQPPPPPPSNSNLDQINAMIGMIQQSAGASDAAQAVPGQGSMPGVTPSALSPQIRGPQNILESGQVPFPTMPGGGPIQNVVTGHTPSGNVVMRAAPPVAPRSPQEANAVNALMLQFQMQQQAQQQAIAAQQAQRHGGGGPFGMTIPALTDVFRPIADQVQNALPPALGDLKDAAGDAVGSAISDPVGTAMGAMSLLDKPRQEIVEDMGNQAYYQATHSGNKPHAGLSVNPYVQLSNLMPDSFLVKFANDPNNWDAIKKAYEEGYDSNGDGKIDFRGGRAVWELYVATNGTIPKIMADIAFDPLTAAGGIGKGAGVIGRAAEVGGTVDMARAARVAEFGGIVPEPGFIARGTGAILGPLGKGTESLLHAADVLPGKVLLDAPKGFIKGEARGLNVLTGGLAGRAALNNPVADAVRYLGSPAARTAAEHINRDLGDALNAVARAGTGLWDAAKGIAPESADNVVTDAANAVPVPEGVVDNAANAVPAEAVPGVDPAFPPPPVPEPHPYGLDQATVDQLGYLAPKVDGDRMVDEVFRGLEQTDPSAKQQFLDRYLPLAQKHIQEMDAIEAARAKALKRGKDVSRFAIDKPLASARHVAEDLNPLAKELLGTDAPAYRYMNEPLGDTFKIIRDETGKILMSRDEVRALDPKIQRLIEDAVFSPDAQLATDARYFLRQQGNKNLQKVADELKRLRELVHGPETVIGENVDTATNAVPTKANPLADVANGVDLGAAPTPPTNPLADLREGVDAPAKPLTAAKPARASAATFDPASADPVGDGLARAVEIGEMTQEQADLLSTTVTFDPKGKRFTGSIVNEPHTLKPVLDPKTGAFIDPIPKQDLTEKRLIDVYVEQLKLGKTPQEAQQVAYDLLKTHVGRPLQDSSSKLGRGLGAALHAYDTMTAAVREHIMYNIFTGPRGVVTDQIGDAIQLTSQGDLRLAARTFDPRKWVQEFSAVRKPAAQAALDMAETRTGQTMDRLGLGVPSGFIPNLGREEVQRSGAMSIPRAIERITGSETAGRISGYATAPLASRNIRDFRTALERTRRFTTYGDALDTGLVDARDRFFNQVREMGDAKGVDVSGMIDNPSSPLYLGDAFSPKDVRTIAK